MSIVDVLIIGGGLVGSYIAGKLSEWGLKVVVLEIKKELNGKTSCTGIISEECAKSFSINGDILLKSINKAILYSPSNRALKPWREKNQAYVIDRTALDKNLAHKAQLRGAHYVTDIHTQSLKHSNGYIEVETSYLNKTFPLRAKVVVVSTGFNIGFIETLGLGKVNDFTLGAQTLVETSGLEELEGFFGSNIAPGFFAWIVPLSSKHARVGLLTRKNPEYYLNRFISTLKNEGKILSYDPLFHYGIVPLTPLPKTFKEHLLVVGDAAGQVKPTTCGGIYYGLLCAEIAVDTISKAFKKGDFSSDFMSKYEKAWREKLEKELKVGYWARSWFERLNDHMLDKLFEIINTTGVLEALTKDENLSFDWHSEAIMRIVRKKGIDKLLQLFKVFPLC